MPQPGDLLAGRYRLLRTVGVGGMGAVMEGVHLGLGERVAVKFLLPSLVRNEEALTRFERESRALVAVKSEHVARVFDVGTDAAGRPYMVMEFLEGRDLGDLVSEAGPLEIPQAVGHLLQTLEAIAEAHASGIVHRDLKPENIFVTLRRDGTSCVKVLDFGLSKMVRVVATDGARPRALTMDDKTLGTPNYMSPEQWMSAKDVGPAADQWSLAAILYELLAGRAAFGGRQVGEVCGKILNSEPEPLGMVRPGLPARLGVAVHRALAKDPRRRFPSVLEFAMALEPFGPAHASLSVRRISGVLSRPGDATAAPPVPSGPDAEERSTDSPRELEPRTPRRLGGPVDATDHFVSTPSWQAAAHPLHEARRRQTRHLLVVAAALGLGALALVGLAVGDDPDAASEPGTATAELGPESSSSAARPRDDTPADASAGAQPPVVDAGALETRPNAPGATPAGSRGRPRRPAPTTTAPKSPSIFDQRW